MIDIKEIKKQDELYTKIIDILENKDEFTTSDFQGAIQAVIMDAMNYGKKQKAVEKMIDYLKKNKCYPAIDKAEEVGDEIDKDSGNSFECEPMYHLGEADPQEKMLGSMEQALMDMESMIQAMPSNHDKNLFRKCIDRLKESIEEAKHKDDEIFRLVDVCIEIDNEIITCRCAIGQYDEENDMCKAWDDSIFYWFEDEKELESAKNWLCDFKVISYENIRKPY